ncbi:MAG: hypothetical protein WC450_11320 [Candidatus Omnitrophota bacterium]|jgi:hypothetical protein
MDQDVKQKVLLELGQVYEKHDLTYGEIFELLELAKGELEHYLFRKKFRTGERILPEEV